MFTKRFSQTKNKHIPMRKYTRMENVYKIISNIAKTVGIMYEKYTGVISKVCKCRGVLNTTVSCCWYLESITGIPVVATLNSIQATRHSGSISRDILGKEGPTNIILHCNWHKMWYAPIYIDTYYRFKHIHTYNICAYACF